MLASLFSFKICVKMNFSEDIKDNDPLVSLLLVLLVLLESINCDCCMYIVVSGHNHDDNSIICTRDVDKYL